MFRFIVLACVLVTGLCAPTDYDDLDLPNLGIVGGYEVDVGHFPHQVSLQYQGYHFCGGSIINERTVLTAAHCTANARPGLTIKAGTSYRTSSNDVEGGVIRNVVKIHDHPNYNPANYDNDISILILDEPLEFNDDTAIKPAVLPTDNQTPAPGEYVIVTGWGHTKENGQGADKLQMVYVPMISNDHCKTKYGSDSITDSMICAGFDHGTQDACQGDSGGPLVDTNNKLVGVVSWGHGCARPDKPGVYTNVAHFIRWILQHIAE